MESEWTIKQNQNNKAKPKTLPVAFRQVMYYLLTQMQIIVFLLLLETSKHFLSVLNKIINEKLLVNRS